MLKKQLLYRSLHRGCKETDIILGKFISAKIDAMTQDDLNLYNLIVETDDQTIFNIVSEKIQIPKELDHHVTYDLINFFKTIKDD